MEEVNDLREPRSDADRIEGLYEEIDALFAKKREGDEQAERKIQEKMEELRALQKREAEKMRETFESRLDMPLDAGRKAVERADELLSRYEDTSGED